MTDDTIETTTKAPIPFPDKQPPADPVAKDEPAPEPVEGPSMTAAQRLRAFEDEVFGVKVSRINGQVERGIGSPYADMTPRQKAHYAALEQLVVTERGVADATASLASAQAAHDAATKASDAAAEAMDETA